jgi:competence protein ComEC
LLAIPFFTFIIVPLVLVGTLLLELNTTLGGWVLHGVAYLLEAAWPLLDWASKLPLAMWHLPELPFWLAAFMLVGCLLAIAPGIAATRIAGAMLCLPALLWQPPKPSQGSFDLAVLDVGQGLAVVVTTQSHVLVYDAGPSFRSGRDTGELVVLPYLFSRGVRRIDTLMLSHGDNDHVGGARSLLAGLPINQVLVGPSVSLPQPVERCIAGQHWQWDQVDFQVLHPATGDAPSKNDSSCVLRIVGNAGDGALLLGDIEHNVESRLVANGTIQQADIVVVPHHGSRTSSTEVLTHAVAPKIAVISAGFGNRWGFPKPDVVARWHAVGARILSTSDSGAVEIAVGVTAEQANSIEVRAYRERDLAYWRQ